MKNIFQYLTLNTIIFNFHYFPLGVAIKLPVFVSRNTKLSSLNGAVILDNAKTGVVKIGFGDVGIFDKSRSRTIWQVNGKVYFHGRAIIGHGSKISVHKDGQVDFGCNFNISAESSIVCSKQISFGDGCLLSWDILIMDTDLHKIYDNNSKEQVNNSKDIIVGDNVWVGCRTTILKGVKIANGCVVAAGSVITKSCTEQNSIYTDKKESLRTNICWVN